MSRRSLHLVILLFLFGVCPAMADNALGKLDARARATLARLRASGQTIETMRRSGAAIDRDGNLDVFIRGSVTRDQLESAGAHVRTALPGLFTASIPGSAVSRVEALPQVVAIRAGAPCRPELDVSVETTGATKLRGPGPGFPGLNGQGVLIGIVDSGVDYQHGDFKDPTGAPRILNIWDQGASGTGPPGLPYPYGNEWSRTQIEDGSCAEVDTLEHGTHIAGIAAGDGSQTGGGKPAFTYAGMAPAADIIIVSTDFQTPEVIDAVNYVFDKATARGENAVVNLSLGTHYGSHDGLSEFEQGVTALLGPGRIVVKSAGNDRGSPVHAEVKATAGGAPVTLSVSGSAMGRLFAVDGYYSAADRLRLQVRTPNGTTLGPYIVNTSNGTWPGVSTRNGDVFIAHDSLDIQRKEIYLEVNVNASNQDMTGTWTITFFADQLGPAQGEVDLWRYLATTGVTANFVTGNMATQDLVSEPGNAENIITVGAWVTKSSWICCNGVVANFQGALAPGNLASFSSPGPSRDGRQKPDLVAPGSAIGSTTSFDIPHTCPGSPTASQFLNDGMNHRMFQGTSMAAPHVAGAIALLLQKRGAMTPQQIKSYLQLHARADGFTGTVPSKDWGYGKLDLGDLIDPLVHVLSPNGHEQATIGESSRFAWTASDSLGSVTAVDLQLSRTGPDGPFESIALGVPNTETYDWMVTGPATNPDLAYLRVLAHDGNGNVGGDLSDAGFTIREAVGVEEGPTTVFALQRVRPNPSARNLKIEFSVACESHVRLDVRDVQGRVVAVLAYGVYGTGVHHATWDGMKGRAPAPAGLYFVRYETPVGSFTKRAIVTR